jgi:C-terminal processing protease CtpA/Prc
MFAKERKHAYNKQTKNGPGKDDFDEVQSFFMEPSPNAYVKPVIVLINFYSVSAAEVFSMYMETQDHVQFLGRHTSQAFSDVSFERFLPNGWSYSMSHQLYSYPNGISPEGTGILPDIPLINDYNEVQAGIDRQLELAISILR